MATIDILPLPKAVMQLTTHSATPQVFEFNDDDIDHDALVREKEQQEREAYNKNREFCSKQPWWECNTTSTNGVCHVRDKQMCVPKKGPAGMSYYQQWLPLYQHLYTASDQKTTNKRDLSVTRKPKIALTPTVIAVQGEP